MMTPHGPLNPATIDPAEYPVRELAIGPDPCASTVIAWFDHAPETLDPDLAALLDATGAADGHVLILTRDTPTMEAVRPLIIAGLRPAGGQA